MTTLTIGERIASARSRRASTAAYARQGKSKMHPYALGRQVQWGDDDDRLQHMEQAAHYQGRAFSVINVNIARISAQPVMIARKILGGASTKLGRKYSFKSMVRSGGLDPKSVPNWVTKNPSLAEDMELLPEHALLDKLARPNNLMTKSNLWEMTLASMDVTGLAYWMLMPSRDDVSLFPLPSPWVKPVHAPDGSEMFSRFEVRPYDAIENPIEVKSQFMARFAYADPFDPIGVISPLQKQARSVLAGEYIEEAQAASFKNSLRPSMAVYTGEEALGDTEIPEPKRRQIVNWIKSQYAGALRHGDAMVMDSIIRDVKPLFASVAEMDYPNSAKLIAENIHEGFATSRIITGNDQNANRAGSATAEHHWTANRANPMISRLGEVMTAQVAPWFAEEGEELYVWLEPITPYDPQLAMVKMQKGFADGVVTINQYLQWLSLPPIDGGDVLMLPKGKSPVRVDAFNDYVDKTQDAADSAREANRPPKVDGQVAAKDDDLAKQEAADERGTDVRRDDALGKLIRYSEHRTKAFPVTDDRKVSDQSSEGCHSFASTQVNVDDVVVHELLDKLRKQIDPADVVEYEDQPHVTVLYGLHGDDPDEARPLVSIDRPKSLTFGRLASFEGDERDVLIVKVSSDDLVNLRRRLSDLPHTSTFPNYKPHMTVAYLKPGTARKYVGLVTGLEGMAYCFTEVMFSDHYRVHTPLKRAALEWAIHRSRRPKAFCPTGDGGGIDNSCSPSGEAGSRGRRETPPKGMAWAKYDAKRKRYVFDDGKNAPEFSKRIPPGWGEAMVAKSVGADLWARGRDKKGRWQSLYSDNHDMRSAAKKFARTTALIDELPEIKETIARDSKNGSESAVVAGLVLDTGLRPGSDKDTLAEKQAYGATTLEGRHVVESDGEVRLEFVAKKGKDVVIRVPSAALQQILRERRESSGNSGRLFTADQGDVLGYIKTLGRGGYKTKDFRTAKGTTLAIETIRTMPAPKGEKEYKAAVRKVAKVVSNQLGNTPAVALQSYINPTVFAQWQ